MAAATLAVVGERLEYPEAFNAWRAAVNLAPDDVGIVTGLGRAAAARGEYHYAICAFDRARAYGDDFGQAQYYLAAQADEVYLHPQGMVLIEGFGGARNYYKEGLDKFGIDVHVFRVGEYKSAVEPYLRDDLDVRPFDRGTVAREGNRWLFRVAGKELRLELPFTQRHLAENVLAALTAYDALGLPLERAQEGAASIRLSAWRGEVRELQGGGLVVNDAYNANPTSMRAALLDLAERADGRRRVAILGRMAELGAESARYHAEIASLLGELGIELVIAVGEEAPAYLTGAEGLGVTDAAAFDEIAPLLAPGDAILVKGSRSVGLEGIPNLIEKLSQAW